MAPTFSPGRRAGLSKKYSFQNKFLIGFRLTTSPDIAKLLQLARAQMAAEAFLRSEVNDALLTDRDDVARALTLGNKHSSKFAAVDAELFASEWRIVDQKKNSPSGFSGALFENKESHELVLSFRSTEFIDDAARDNLATNTLEIKDTGFAWGQLADMQAWYKEMRDDPARLKDKQFTVTGYSLGGHLATAFNQMHGAEANGVTRVVTFNGAGVGKLKFTSDSLNGLVNQFNAFRTGSSAVEDIFIDASLKTKYQEVRQILNSDAWNAVDTLGKESLLAQARTALNAYSLPSDPQLPYREEFVAQLGWVSDALSDIKKVVTEAKRVESLSSGGTPSTKPDRVPDSEIAAETLDYRMAVKIVSQRTESASILGGAVRALAPKVTLPGGGVDNQSDVVGDTMPSLVSHSQWHIGKDVRVFIEDQPLVRGGYIADLLGASLDNKSIELLVNNYAIKDFGDTHSLVLLVDSLAVQNTLFQLMPAAQHSGADALLKGVLKQASNLEKVNGDATVGAGQGKAEGNVMENVVNALGEMFIGSSFAKLKANLDGGTWAEVLDKGGYSGRNSLYVALNAIQQSDAYKASLGSVTVSAAPTDATLARDDFGVFLALLWQRCKRSTARRLEALSAS